MKNLPAMWETWVSPLGQEEPLEEGKATLSSILAGSIPMDRGFGGLQFMGLQKYSHSVYQTSRTLSSPNETLLIEHLSVFPSLQPLEAIILPPLSLSTLDILCK